MADGERLRPTGLQKKLGGRAGLLVTPETLALAAARLEAMAPQALEEIASELRRFQGLVAAGPPYSARILFQCLHDLRGLAGTFGAQRLADAARIACEYFDALGDTGQAEPAAVHMLNAMLCKAQQSGEDARWPYVLNEARAAVAHLIGRCDL